jgi:hypothetical protein
MELGILLERKKALESAAPLFKFEHLLKDFFGPGAHLGVSLARLVDVPAQAQKHNDGDSAQKTRTGQKFPVSHKRLCRQIEPNPHSSFVTSLLEARDSPF